MSTQLMGLKDPGVYRRSAHLEARAAEVVRGQERPTHFAVPHLPVNLRALQPRRDRHRSQRPGTIPSFGCGAGSLTWSRMHEQTPWNHGSPRSRRTNDSTAGCETTTSNASECFHAP